VAVREYLSGQYRVLCISHSVHHNPVFLVPLFHRGQKPGTKNSFAQTILCGHEEIVGGGLPGMSAPTAVVEAANRVARRQNKI
jgi:hypothetical protein